MPSTRRQSAEPLWEPSYLRAAARAVRPKERMTLEAWAERYEKITREDSLPGPYRFDNTPWLRGIAAVLDPRHPAKEIVFMKGAQIGATRLGNVWIGYCIERYPCRILQVQPNLELAKRYSRTMISPMIRDNPILKNLVSPEKSRDGSNTILAKSFPGGGFYMTGANSAVGLRQIAARFLFTDERDGYVIDLDGEGSPFSLAKKRTDSYGAKAKIYSPSTPTIKGESVIEFEYERSNKARFFVPCPRCGERQVIVFTQVKWPTGRPEAAELECIECGKMWNNAERIEATKQGEWVDEIPWALPMPYGFHLSGLYSHFLTLGDHAVEFLRTRNKPEDFKTFVNTSLAETYTEYGEYETSAESIAKCAERYDARVPTGVQVLTVGVDIQADRIELVVLGWGRAEECWTIEHKVLPGDTTGWPVWEDLFTYLGQPFEGLNGKAFYIQGGAIDAGYQMQNVLAAVKEFNRRRPAQKVYAVKGSADPLVKVWPSTPQRNNRYHVPLYTINVSAIKETIMGRLKHAEATEEGHTPGLQLFHFSAEHDPDFFDQLMSERQIPRLTRGKRHRSQTGRVSKDWVLRRPGQRNEVLDCVVYGYGALQGWISLGNRFAAVVAPAPRPPAARAGGEGDGTPDAEDLSRVATAAAPVVSRQPVESPAPPVAAPQQARPRARRQPSTFGFSTRRRKWTGGT
jgi:phage terminase large subunit GpA-like protein